MTAKYIVGKISAVLDDLPDASVDLVVTSWPYLGLRSYLPEDHPDKADEIGTEGTPAEYIDSLLRVTSQLRRVLAPHGTLATELGDSFSGSGGAGGDYDPDGLRAGQPRFEGSARRARVDGRDAEAWPLAKSLCMVPELYRVGLVYGMNPLTGEASPAGRWRARNVVVHGRPNPPVGALGDKWRPACSYWALACTSGKRWFDLDAVREPPTSKPQRRFADDWGDRAEGQGRTYTSGAYVSDEPIVVGNPAGAPPRDWFVDQYDDDLWVIPTFGYPGAHYATFSPKLVKRFVESMCPSKVCVECGEPSRRIVEVERLAAKDDSTRSKATGRLNGQDHPPESGWEMQRTTVGWTDCGHDAWRPGVVLDPFAGSGTTLAVATGTGRDAIGVDIDERNAALALERCGMFIDIDDGGPARRRTETVPKGELL